MRSFKDYVHESEEIHEVEQGDRICMEINKTLYVSLVNEYLQAELSFRTADPAIVGTKKRTSFTKICSSSSYTIPKYARRSYKIRAQRSYKTLESAWTLSLAVDR